MPALRTMVMGETSEVSYADRYYEVTGSSITKYYYAGAQRVAMRQYKIPEPITPGIPAAGHPRK